LTTKEEKKEKETTEKRKKRKKQKNAKSRKNKKTTKTNPSETKKKKMTQAPRAVVADVKSTGGVLWRSRENKGEENSFFHFSIISRSNIFTCC